MNVSVSDKSGRLTLNGALGDLVPRADHPVIHGSVNSALPAINVTVVLSVRHT